MTVIVLRRHQVEVYVDVDAGVPTIVHWGAPLGDIDTTTLRAAVERPIVAGMLDVVAPISVVPEEGSGYYGRPGLAGHRMNGRAWSPRFAPSSVVADGEHGVTVVAVDAVAELTLTTTIHLGETLVVQCRLDNDGADPYVLDRLSVTVALPAQASELLRFTGRWSRELHPVRAEFTSGVFAAENRSGRTSAEYPPLLFAGTPGFGEWHGEVWGMHLAWSGNHHIWAEVLNDTRRAVQFGELLQPGEIVLQPGQSYDTPELYGSYSATGLTNASWGFHRTLRARPTHPTSERPVMLNIWEAVYFDHDNDRLRDLATVAASVGVERYVVDDGWFGSRRHDGSGLGDWVVSPDVYPDGLAPLIQHVTDLGMEFGIWVEPEMVNPDSDVYRAHPEWALVTNGYEPVLGRSQLLLNLAHPGAFAHVLGQLDALLRDHDISYVKWDMNRNHCQASGADDAAGTHAQTLAFYRLISTLGQRHPHVEFESCSSGGGRIDFEVLRHTQRVWTSDCIDPLERQTIQRNTSLFIPPELMGAHIASPTSHVTGRTHNIGFRSVTALFGHLGIEWNLLTMNDRDRETVTAVIELYKRFRQLIHHGDLVRFDTAANGPGHAVDPAGIANGVYAADRSEALIAVTQLRTGTSLAVPPLRLPGLDPSRRYRILKVSVPGERGVPVQSQPGWLTSGITLSGRQLAVLGLQMPAMNPETSILLHFEAQP